MTGVETSASHSGSARRWFAILTGLTLLFIFIQSFTAGEFVNQRSDSAEIWTAVHGFVAYPVMVFALAAAITAFAGLRRNTGSLWLWSAALFVLTVVQWLLGHAITTLELDGFIAPHVVLAFVVFGLAIWLSVRSAALRRTSSVSVRADTTAR